MRLEWTFFLHFGPNAFHDVEWGSGREEPSLFNPTAFDADQWVRAMAKAGGKMIVLVCKHHDGLCLWQTRYTPHSVASSPWLDGKGSVVKAVADAAHKYGLKLGVYLSPADLYQLRTNPKNPGGYYGDGSSLSFRHSYRSGQFQIESRLGTRADAGLHQLHLRRGRLQSLLPEPTL